MSDRRVLKIDGAQIMVDPRTGRLECPYCGSVVGQAGVGGVMVADKHDAPCGLLCVGSSQKHWLDRRGPDFNHGAMHTGAGTCTRCKPRPCPACQAVGHIETTARDAARNGHGGTAVHELARLNGDARVTVKCGRCDGKSMIRGPE